MKKLFLLIAIVTIMVACSPSIGNNTYCGIYDAPTRANTTYTVRLYGNNNVLIREWRQCKNLYFKKGFIGFIYNGKRAGACGVVTYTKD